ncbi:MAG: hypothetical protein ACRYFU_04745 [Janthinobacterium lividum]
MTARVIAAFAIFLAPLLTVAVWKIRKIQGEVFTAERQALPFVPTTAPVGLAFLHRLSSVERRYLLLQIKSGIFLFGFATWFFTFVLTLPIVFLHHFDRWFNASALLWFEFLRNSSNSTQFITMALFGCVFMAVVPLRFQAEARFYRTRPIRIGFLFWSRVLCVLVPILLAAAAGIAIATLLLVTFHGPVWRNLPVHIPRVLDADDADIAQDYLRLLRTSAPRIFLSILTTISLFFTAVLALAMVPFLRGRTVGSSQTVAAPVKILFVMAFFPLLVTFARFGSFQLPAFLFIYTSLGPPPPYLFALIPLALSLGFLALARLFVKHLEI